jgi:hypothetical protein
MTLDRQQLCDAQAQIFGSPGFIDALVDRETQLRIDYQRMPSAPSEEARQIVRGATALIEILYVSAVCIESAHRCGVTTLRQMTTCGGEIFRMVHSLTSLPTMNVVQENAKLIQQMEQISKPQPEDLIPELSGVVSSACAMERTFPEKELTELATRFGIHEYGARITFALDGIRRLITRNDPLVDQRMRTLGPEYVAGELTLDQVAGVLGLNIPDTVARLEDCGFARPVEHVALTEHARDELYAELRKMRAQGVPSGARRVMRDVIATQRIEGIDARVWIDPKLV